MRWPNRRRIPLIITGSLNLSVAGRNYQVLVPLDGNVKLRRLEKIQKYTPPQNRKTYFYTDRLLLLLAQVDYGATIELSVSYFSFFFVNNFQGWTNVRYLHVRFVTKSDNPNIFSPLLNLLNSIVPNVHQPRKSVTTHFMFWDSWSKRLVREPCKWTE